MHSKRKILRDVSGLQTRQHARRNFSALVVGAVLAACSLPDAADIVATGTLREGLGRTECVANLPDGKVGICHATGSAGTPFVHLRTSVSGCLNGHSRHASDFVSVDSRCPVCVTPPDGLVAWWPADSNTSDIVGGHDGGLVGDAGFAAGQVGSAFRFDGSSGLVAVPHDAEFDFGRGPFTFELWFSSEATDRFALLDRRVPGGNFPGYWLLVDSNLVLDFGADTCSTAGCGLDKRVQTDLAPFLDAAWHHLAAVRDGAALQIYLDGALRAEQSFATAEDVNGAAELLLGVAFDRASDFFPGQIDELSAYARALTADEIQAIYAAGTAGKCR